MGKDLQPCNQYWQQKDDEIDLREMAAVLWHARKIILSITFIRALLAVAYSLALPNQYKASAVIAPAKNS